MKTHVLKGSKQDIADGLARIRGEVREAIVFVDEPLQVPPSGGTTPDTEDIFGAMIPFMVDAEYVDDSREAIYLPMEGE